MDQPFTGAWQEVEKWLELLKQPLQEPIPPLDISRLTDSEIVRVLRYLETGMNEAKRTRDSGMMDQLHRASDRVLEELPQLPERTADTAGE